MKFKILFFSLFLNLTLSSILFAEIGIVTLGTFHENESSAKNAEKWYGIFPEEGYSTAKEFTVKVEKVFDAIVDSEGQKTGDEVSIDSTKEPLFLVRGIKSIPAKIPTAFSAKAESMMSYSDGKKIPPAKKLSLKIERNKNCQLKASGQRSKDPETENIPMIKNYRLKFICGKLSQEIHRIESDEEYYTPILVWAGDLDGDGKIDLVLNYTQYNMSSMKLYLSSLRQKGELVKEVADFTTTGC